MTVYRPRLDAAFGRRLGGADRSELPRAARLVLWALAVARRDLAEQAHQLRKVTLLQRFQADDVLLPQHLAEQAENLPRLFARLVVPGVIGLVLHHQLLAEDDDRMRVQGDPLRQFRRTGGLRAGGASISPLAVSTARRPSAATTFAVAATVVAFDALRLVGSA